MIPIGRVVELVRYPIKSMAGIATESAFLGRHGIAGDRRFAFRKLNDRSGFPWLSASRLPELVMYHPVGLSDAAGEPAPTHVRTPSGDHLELHGEELRDEITRKFGSAVELMMLKHGIFDDASLSVMSLATIAGIGRETGMEIDRRRMRANVLLETGSVAPFFEDEWVDATLVFGDGADAPAVTITARDERCVMMNIDPDTAEKDARVMKTVVRLNGNYAGVYGTVVREGSIHVGQTASLIRA
jgi:uncharacterized protein YcbX